MKIILSAIGGAIVLGLGWYLISPLWRNVTLDEQLPQAPVIQDTMDAATKEQFMKAVDAMKDKVMVGSDAMPSQQPIVLAETPLVARAHDVAGKGLLLQIGDQKVLRFENLKTINGPDLRIYLSSGLNVNDAIDLGPIRATEGNVNYSLPAGIDTTRYRNALIWCRAFGVLFSYAQF